MTDLPGPLIGTDIDLRDFPEFPLRFEQLFTSDTWIICNAEEKVAALRLWCKSWHQEPTGSLPRHDRLLANLAGYGEAVSAWAKVRENAMRGWIACADGRFYHPVVCSIALEKWEKKKKRRKDNEADRERKSRKRASVLPDINGNTASCPVDKPPLSTGQDIETSTASSGIPPENALKGSEEKGSKSSVPNGTGTAVPIVDSTKALFDAGIVVLANSGTTERHARSMIGKWRKDLADDEKLIGLFVTASKAHKVDALAWLEKSVKETLIRQKNPDGRAWV